MNRGKCHVLAALAVLAACESMPSAEQLLTTAIKEYRSGDFEAAGKGFEAAKKAQPKSAEPRAWLCRTALRKDPIDLAKASAEVEEALSLDPLHADALACKAEVLWRDNKVNEAETFANRAVAHGPTLAAGYAIRGIIRTNRGALEGALSDAGKSIELEPNHISYNNRAAVYLRRGNAALALEDLAQSLAARPDYVPAFINKAKAYAMLGRDDDALALFEDLLRGSTRKAQALVARAGFYMERKNHERSMLDLEAVLKERQVPNIEAEALALRCEVLVTMAIEQTRDLEAADRACAESLQRTPNDPITMTNRGAIQQIRGDYPNALRTYAGALRLDPNYVQALINKGLLLADLGRCGEAVVDLKLAVQLGTKDEAVRTTLRKCGGVF